MASGHLSPFPSYASGLGFLPSPGSTTPSEHSNLASPHPSYHSLLTPTASVCTISSLSQCGDTEARGRTKTMQTKDILKSPQPHRFQLVLSSSKRVTPEPPALGARPGTQWQYKQKGSFSPRSVESGPGDTTEETCDGYDLFSPEASPLISETALHSPQSPCVQGAVSPDRHTPEISYGDLAPHRAAHVSVFSDIRPTSIGSTLSAQITSVSFTLVQDQPSKRFSSASETTSKAYDSKPEYAEPRFDVEPVVSADETHPYYEPTQADLVPAQCGDLEVLTSQPTAEHSRNGSNIIAGELHSDPSGGIVGQTIITPTTSSTVESLISQYQLLPEPGLPSEDHLPHAISPTPSPKSARRATAGSLDSPSPSKQPPTRDRRKFALRRQAIYAEYGFQIALPDSDSETSVKLLASPSKRAMQGRTASAYVLSGSNSRSALSVSCSGLGASVPSLADSLSGSTGNDSLVDTDDALFAVGTPHCAQATDRLERYSVQDDILGATRNPLLDTLADLTTSTPQKSRSTSRRSFASTQAPCAPVPDVPCLALPGKLTAPGNVWQPLCIQKRNPTTYAQPKEQQRIPLSKSERRARLSAYEVDHGHHPIMQALVDDVERAIEQWRWTAQLRVYL
ncbi:hypothetical protein C8Q79DRAFT_1012175 [Trametes meyenii]|nr:hypothetical protein C8Q79DRAFT_1012175 [Trametes meyenii]